MASGWLPLITATVIFLFLTPFMRSRLGDSRLGIWYLLLSLAGYMSLLRWGLMAGLTKYTAEFRAASQPQQLQSLFCTAILQYAIMAVPIALAGVGLFITAGYIPSLRSSGEFQTVRMALALLLLNFLLYLPADGIRSILEGFQRFAFNNLLQSLGIVLQAGIFVFVILRGYGLIGLAMGLVLVTVFLLIVSAVFLYRVFPFRFSIRGCRKSLLGRLFHFSFYSFLTSLGETLFYKTDAIVIGWLIGNAEITYYALGFQLVDRIRNISSSALRALMPVASEISTLPEDRRKTSLKELFTRGTRFSAILTVPLFLFLLLFGHPFIALWQGKDYAHAEESYGIYLILAIPHIFAISQQVGGLILFGLARYRFIAVFWFVLALLNLGFSMILGNRYGIEGVAWGTSIPVILMLAVMQVYYKRAFQIPMISYFKQSGGRLAWIALAFAGVLVFVRRFWLRASLPAILALGATATLAFWTAGYWTLDSYEKQVVRNLLQKLPGFGAIAS